MRQQTQSSSTQYPEVGKEALPRRQFILTLAGKVEQLGGGHAVDARFGEPIEREAEVLAVEPRLAFAAAQWLCDSIHNLKSIPHTQ